MKSNAYKNYKKTCTALNGSMRECPCLPCPWIHRLNVSRGKARRDFYRPAASLGLAISLNHKMWFLGNSWLCSSFAPDNNPINCCSFARRVLTTWNEFECRRPRKTLCYLFASYVWNKSNMYMSRVVGGWEMYWDSTKSQIRIRV